MTEEDRNWHIAYRRRAMKTLRYQMFRLKQKYPDLKYRYAPSDELGPFPGVILETPLTEAFQQDLNEVGLALITSSADDLAGRCWGTVE